VFAAVRVELFPDGVHGFHDQVLYLRNYVPVDRDPAIRVRVVYDLLKPLVAKLVPIFEGPIILGIFLHGIISQVHILIIDVLQIHLEL
jgi:hypothetical protein